MQTLTAPPAAVAEDVGNIVSLEHVNAQVPDQFAGNPLLFVGLGFTRDPYMNVGLTNMWVNIGDQQFHLPTGNAAGVARAHRTGRAGPARGQGTPGLDRRSVEGTKFKCADRGEYVEAVSPWGNVYRVYAAGSHGAMKLGVPYLELTVPVARRPQSSASTSRCSRRPAVSGPRGARRGRRRADARVPRVHEVPEYDGHHIAVYIANFSGPFDYLSEHAWLPRVFAITSSASRTSSTRIRAR